MSHNGRALIRPGLLAYAQAFAEARAELHENQRELSAQIAELRAEVDRLHEEIRELRAVASDVVTTLRRKADQDLAQLRHQLEIALVRLTKRDPAQPLQ